MGLEDKLRKEGKLKTPSDFNKFRNDMNEPHIFYANFKVNKNLGKSFGNVYVPFQIIFPYFLFVFFFFNFMHAQLFLLILFCFFCYILFVVVFVYVFFFILFFCSKFFYFFKFIKLFKNLMKACRIIFFSTI